MVAAPTKKPESKEEPKVEATQLDPWQGPFPEYEIVKTPFGEYGIEAFKILDFEGRQKVNKETMEIDTEAFPVYRPATDAELKAADLEGAKNYTLPHDHPDKLKAKVDADKGLKDRIKGLKTASVNPSHAGSKPGHV